MTSDPNTADDIEEAVFRARAQIEDDGSQDDTEVLLHAGHIRSMLNEIDRLRAALDHIRLECEATHTGQERAYTALSRIDGIARRALA